MDKSLIIIGGGAAGFFCAIQAKKLNPTLRITILEKHNKVLQKVKVSGGGRCNVTHQGINNTHFLKNYPRGKDFLKKSFTLFDFIDTQKWFQERGVTLVAEDDGRMFPKSNSSQTIIDCFFTEINKLGVEIIYNAEVISAIKKDLIFNILLKNNTTVNADFVCIACGGLTKLEQFNWIKNLMYNIENPVPSLFTFNLSKHTITELMGINVQNVSVKIMGEKLEQIGDLLITHWGFSGPAVLKLSAWGAKILYEKKYHFTVIINWINTPESNLLMEWNSIRNQQGKHLMGHKNPFHLPSRLWHYLLAQCSINESVCWSELPSKQQHKLIKLLTTHEFQVEGKTIFKEEFVTCGGVNTKYINPLTMESNSVSNLFFAGEVLNIDGITGGFNFQNAWTTGWIAGNTIGKKSN